MHRAEYAWRRWVASACLAVAAWNPVVVPELCAATRPPQLLLTPWEMPRPDFGREGAASTAVVFDGQSFEFPDSRHGEIYRLSIVRAIGPRHHARFSQEYAGVESADRFQWGGGRTEIQWTSRLGALQGLRGALDAAGSLSTGDEELHPLSAGAPTLRLRARVQWLPTSEFELWTGAGARLVSPPSETDRRAPRGVFPSGNSYDATLRWVRPHWTSAWTLRHDRGGLPQSWWARWRMSVDVGEQLTLRLAAHAGLGPVESRMIDRGWSVGVSWSPPLGLSADPQTR